MRASLFFELKNPWLRQRFSVRRGDKIRTCDPLHPIQVRYRAALLPEQLHIPERIGVAKVRQKKLPQNSTLRKLLQDWTHSCVRR